MDGAGAGGDCLRVTYEEAIAQFRIDNLIGQLQGDLTNGLNASVECCDRHCGRERVALRWIAADGHLEEFTFEKLRDISARFANVLAAAGIGSGDVVAGLLPKTPELIATVLGTLRVGAAYQPLFTAFGPKAIEHRLKSAHTQFVVTDTTNREKLADIADCPQVATVAAPGATVHHGDLNFHAAIASASSVFEAVMRGSEDLMLMMATSGTSGLPKSVAVPNRALLSFGAYMRDAVDLHADDVFWNIADPGWAYGLFYGVIGPLLLGQATTFSEAGFSAERFSEIVERLGVTNLAGSPTAFRLLMRSVPDIAGRIKGRLRVVSSAGEPLNPEVIRWFDRALDAPIYDHYGQTEVGMVVNNHHGLDHPVRPGSAGYAMPGYRAVVLDDAGNELGPNRPGVLAIDLTRSPLFWFNGYHEQETPAIAGGYYRTGDTVEFEPDGSISFIGRADDVITSSGYRIGPFDVESALLEHPAVVDAAVIGIPDPLRTEIVKAFVILADGQHGSPELAEELQLWVRNRLAAHSYPRLIDFVENLPRTPSGKLQRFVLRKVEIERLEKSAPES